MLVHHDSRPYEVAAKEASAAAKAKLQTMFNEALENARATYKTVMTQVPQDALIRGSALSFESMEGGVGVGFVRPDTKKQEVFGIHRHAMDQFASKVGIPIRYLTHLRDIMSAPDGAWARDLLTATLQEHYKRHDDRIMLRSVNGEVRGALSASYRRMDARPLLEAFVTAAKEFGALPIKSYALDTKTAFRMMVPTIYEPAPGEVIAFGLQFRASDFGDAPLEVSVLIDRLWCTNLAIMETVLRKVHLGARLDEQSFYSEKTHELQMDTMVSAMHDLVRDSLGPERTTAVCDAIADASTSKIDAVAFMKQLREDGKLLKNEADKIAERFNSPDVELLPPGNTLWRASNAISLFAQDDGVSPERAIELNTLAGAILA